MKFWVWMENKMKNITTINSYHEFNGQPEIAVVMDIFRASNTILSILASGAEYVIPKTANTEDEVKAIRAEYPDHVFFGEHRGIKFDNADYDNSPSKATELDLTGKKVIIASSMGTKAVVAIRVVSLPADCVVVVGLPANAISELASTAVLISALV